MRAIAPMALSLFVLSRALCAAPAIAAGQISGTVLDQAGQPLAGATVHYHASRRLAPGRRGVPQPTGTAIRGTVLTGPDGSFTIADQPAGTYYLCASGVNAAQLSTCAWSGGEKMVAVTAGQVRSVSLQLPRGAVITFHVSDPNHRIADSSFIVGVFCGYAYSKAIPVAAAGAMRTWQVTVPSSGAFRVLLGTSLRVTDARGNAIATGQPGPPIAVNGRKAISIALAIP